MRLVWALGVFFSSQVAEIVILRMPDITNLKHLSILNALEGNHMPDCKANRG